MQGPPFHRVLGIIKSDARFGTGPSLARNDYFFKVGFLPKTIHHLEAENASKQHTTKHCP